MDFVDLILFGPVEDAVMEALEGCVRSGFGLTPRRLPPLPDPLFAYDPARGQFDSARILREVFERRDPRASRVLGVTRVDLYIPVLSFVFGQAQLEGPAALVSLARLRQEFYGFPPDVPLLLERTAKEALHELGHSFGLIHCPDPACVISLSSSIEQVDAKNGAFCPGCRALLEERLAEAGSIGRDPGPREGTSC